MSWRACASCPRMCCSESPIIPSCGRWLMSRKHGSRAWLKISQSRYACAAIHDKRFPGKVALVYPHLTPSTRTVRVRVELPNPDFVLRPDMYAEAEIDTGSGQP